MPPKTERKSYARTYPAGFYYSNIQSENETTQKSNAYRELFRLALVHRCVHGWAPTYLAECYETNIRYGHCITRGVKKLHLKSVNTEFGRRATMFKGAQDWNKLPANLRNVQNTKTFRKLLKTQYFCT